MIAENGSTSKLQFHCLDPRKTKRRIIQRVLAPLGALSWTRMPPLRLIDYSETSVRAQMAYDAARQPATNKLFASLQKRLYGWQYNGSRAWFERNRNVIGVAWNGLNGSRRAFIDGAHDAGAGTLFFELSPFMGRVTCDPIGVNQANSLSRDPAFYTYWLANSGLAADLWREEKLRIVQRAPAKTKLSAMPVVKQTGHYLFVPLQVPGDSQLRLFGGQFRTVPDFIDALFAAADHLPENWHLKIKEHPTAAISFADQIIGRNQRVLLDNSSDTFALVEGSSGVVTVNSSVGLEAMFFDKPVIACGDCFWGIPGVADSAIDCAAIASAFRNAETLSFDKELRSAFLNYLLDEYYVSMEGGPIGAQKIQRRLKPTVPQ